MSTLATLTAVFDSDVTGLKKGVAETNQELTSVGTKADAAANKSGMAANKVGRDWDATSKKMSSAGKRATLFMTTPILGAGVAAFKAASDLGESMSKVSVVFGENAKDIESWASTAATSMGQSKQEALEAAGTLGNLFRAIGIGTPKAAEMSKTMVGLAGDLASFNNASPEEAMTALRSGLVGETEPLKRFGINLNEARLKQEALNMGLTDGKGTLDANAKAQAAYALIMKDSKLAQGDFARTAEGAANQQRIVTAQFKDAAAVIGTKLLPLGTKLLGWAGKFAGWLFKLSPGMQNVVLGILGIVAVMGPLLVVSAKVIQAVQVLNKAFKFAEATSKVIEFATTTGKAFAQMALDAAKATGRVIASIARATAAMVVNVARQVAAWVLLGVQSLAAAAKVALAWLISIGPIALVIAAVVGLVFIIVKNWTTIKNFIIGAATAVWNFLKKWGPMILAVLTGPIGLIVLLVVKNWTKIKNFVVSMMTNIRNFVGGAISAVVGFFASLPGKIISFLSSLPGKLYQIGRNMIQSLINGVAGMAGALVNKARSVVSGAINAAKNLLGIGSPSKVFMALGKNVGEGMVIGLDSKRSAVNNAVGRLMPRGGAVSIGVGSPAGRTPTPSPVASLRQPSGTARSDGAGGAVHKHYELAVHSKQSLGSLENDFRFMEARAG